MDNISFYTKINNLLNEKIDTSTENIQCILEKHSHYTENKKIDISKLSKDIYDRCTDIMSTNDLYYLIADQCASMMTHDPDYDILASRISVERLHKFTADNYSQVLELLYNNYGKKGEHIPMINDKVYNFAKENLAKIEEKLDYERDYKFDFFGLRTLERSYLYNKKIGKQQYIIERPQHMIMRIGLAIHVDDLDAAFETYDLMSNKYFTHATPTLYNAGSLRQQLSSCFLMLFMDNLSGMYDKIKTCAEISKWSGGIGICISNIRSTGSLIRGTNGESNGIIPLIKVLEKVSVHVNQGGKRKGSIAIYNEPWHADIFEFCELRKNIGDENLRARDIFLGLWVPDLFMKRVIEDGVWSLMCPDECPGLVDSYGDEFDKLYTEYENNGQYKKQIKAIDLWYHIMEAQIETGMPYMLYKDHCNRKSNQKNLGTIKCSNLCVDGETFVLTDRGHIKIKDIVNEFANVWNGKEWSNVQIKKTGSNKNLIRVNLSNGAYIDCTPEHKFHLAKGTDSSIEIEAQELKQGDKLLKFDLPFIEFEDNSFKYPYTHGFFCGDGTTYKNYSKTKDYPKLYLYGEKKKLVNYIEKESFSVNGDRFDIVLPKDLEAKFKVPCNTSTETRLRWLEGYADADGTISKNGENESLQMASINKDFLLEIKLMLQTLGIDCKVTLGNTEREVLLPDGKGGKKIYDCKPLYRILVSSNGLYDLHKLGFSPKRLKISGNKPQRYASHFVKVISIEKSKEDVDTFCFTEPKRHMGVFNGILTGQCTEIVEYTSEKETAVCNLNSICLPAFIKDPINKEFDYEKLGHVARVSVRNLNKIIDINYYPTEETKYSNMKHRPIGIGVQGLVDVFNIFEYSFGSEESKKLNKKIFETIYYNSVDESCKLAQQNGKYESYEGSPISNGQLQWHLWELEKSDLLMDYDWDKLIDDIGKYGVRNSLLTTIMPTASTSQIMGNTESIEPHLSNIFTRTTLAGEFPVINKNLIRSLMRENLWSEDMRDKIVAYQGSVQNIMDIPHRIRQVYKTAFELYQKDIITLAKERGPFICQSQSMNLFMDQSDFDKLSNCHLYSWESGLKTGMYYLRSKPAVDPSQFGLDVDKLKSILDSDKVVVCKRGKRGVNIENCEVCSA